MAISVASAFRRKIIVRVLREYVRSRGAGDRACDHRPSHARHAALRSPVTAFPDIILDARVAKLLEAVANERH